MAVNINIESLTRNHKKISSSLSVNSDGNVVSSKRLRLYFPSRFDEIGFNKVGTVVNLISIYVLVDDDDNYLVKNSPIRIDSVPTSIKEVKMDNESYYELTFEVGDAIVKSLEVVDDSGFIFKVFKEILEAGNKPWFMDYEGTINLFTDNSDAFPTPISDFPIAIEIVVGEGGRTKKDKKLTVNQSIDKKEEADSIFHLVGINSVNNMRSVAARIVGPRLKVGLTSALAENVPKKEAGTLEKIYRT